LAHRRLRLADGVESSGGYEGVWSAHVERDQNGVVRPQVIDEVVGFISDSISGAKHEGVGGPVSQADPGGKTPFADRHTAVRRIASHSAVHHIVVGEVEALQPPAATSGGQREVFPTEAQRGGQLAGGLPLIADVESILVCDGVEEIGDLNVLAVGGVEAQEEGSKVIV